MSKPRKVEEPQAPYAAKKPAKTEPTPKTDTSGVRYMDDATFRKAAEKIFTTRSDLLRRLAQ